MASKALVVTGLVVNAILWSQSRYATLPSTSQSTAWSTSQSTPPDARLGLSSLLARAWTEPAAVDDTTFFTEEKTVSSPEQLGGSETNSSIQSAVPCRSLWRTDVTTSGKHAQPPKLSYQ